MSRDLRLYSLCLLIVLMLWNTPANATYGSGSNCPALAVPADPVDGLWAVWNGDGELVADYRSLYPVSGTDAHVTQNRDANGNYWEDCRLYAGSGSYYDGANHLWVLDNALNCYVNYDGYGEFRAGDDY